MGGYLSLFSKTTDSRVLDLRHDIGGANRQHLVFYHCHRKRGVEDCDFSSHRGPLRTFLESSIEIPHQTLRGQLGDLCLWPQQPLQVSERVLRAGPGALVRPRIVPLQAFAEVCKGHLVRSPAQFAALAVAYPLAQELLCFSLAGGPGTLPESSSTD